MQLVPLLVPGHARALLLLTTGKGAEAIKAPQSKLGYLDVQINGVLHIIWILKIIVDVLDLVRFFYLSFLIKFFLFLVLLDFLNFWIFLYDFLYLVFA